MRKNSGKKRQALCGLGAGLLNGLFGTGGGILLVFFYETYLGFEKKRALATALFVMVFLSVLRLIFLSYEIALPWKEMPSYVMGGIFGGAVGGCFFKQVSPAFLQKLFGAFLLLAGVKGLFLS